MIHRIDIEARSDCNDYKQKEQAWPLRFWGGKGNDSVITNILKYSWNRVKCWMNIMVWWKTFYCWRRACWCVAEFKQHWSQTLNWKNPIRSRVIDKISMLENLYHMNLEVIWNRSSCVLYSCCFYWYLKTWIQGFSDEYFKY